ncbi:Glycosyl transferases group 1 [compost metagenome]
MKEEFTSSLDGLLINNPNVRLAIVGNFDNYDRVIQQYTGLKQQSIFIGYQKDLSAVYTMCDIYLNPPRSGGGTSAAEALYMGVPVLTYPLGDVSYIARERNYINSMDEVGSFLRKWEDPSFRKIEIDFALERANEIFDPDKVKQDMIQEMIKKGIHLIIIGL